MKTETKTRITTTVDADLAREFAELTRDIGISGTALLSRTLHSELDYLEGLPPNSEEDERALRRNYPAGGGGAKGDAKAPLIQYLKSASATAERFLVRKGRINITLDRQDAERLDRLCQEKRILRDGFIHCYIDFLVHGEDGVCEAPLAKISKLLSNPRHDYEEARESGPTEDETFWNQEDGHLSCIVKRAVPRKHPYGILHLPALIRKLAGTIQEISPDWTPEECLSEAAGLMRESVEKLKLPGRLRTPEIR